MSEPLNEVQSTIGYCLRLELSDVYAQSGTNYDALPTREKCALVCGAMQLEAIGGRHVDFYKTPCPVEACSATQSWKITRDGLMTFVSQPPKDCLALVSKKIPRMSSARQTRLRREVNRTRYPQLNLFNITEVAYE